MRYAYEYARTVGRKKVTVVHKATVMKMADGLFLDCAREMASEYKDIIMNEIVLDSACLKVC